MIGRGLRLVLPEPSMDLLLLPQTGRQHPDAGEADWLALDTAAGVLHIEDGERFLACLTGIDGSSSDDNLAAAAGATGLPWPSWLTGAIAGRLRDTPLASLRTVWPLAALPADDLVMLQLRLHDEDHAVSSMAAALPQVWLALLADADVEPLRMPLSDWLSLTLSFPVVLATHRLPPAAYDQLACGDLILPAKAHFDIAGQGLLVLGGRRWQAGFIQAQRLQLFNEENHVDTDMMDDDTLDDTVEDSAEETIAGQPHAEEDEGAHGDHRGEREDSAEEGGLPGALGLNLRFELGRLRLTLDQLRALGPLSVLELHVGSPQSIAICCGGAEVGRGEVVDVDGQLGVRITQWGGAC